jgi:acyl-CoA thioesterase FadM
LSFDDSTLTLRVRPNDLDSLGHVNNATALEYLEAGRWAWMELNGLRKAKDIIAVTMRVEVDYRKEIAFQELVVRTLLEEPLAEDLEEEGALHYRVRFHQQILVDSGRIVAVEAKVQTAFINAVDRSLRTAQDFLIIARSPAS